MYSIEDIFDWDRQATAILENLRKLAAQEVIAGWDDATIHRAIQQVKDVRKHYADYYAKRDARATNPQGRQAKDAESKL